jgi:hypothetical protein
VSVLKRTFKEGGRWYFRINSPFSDSALCTAEEHELLDEIERLRRWKAEAILVLNDWDSVWLSLDIHGQLGEKRSETVINYINELRARVNGGS